MIAFSTNEQVRRNRAARQPVPAKTLTNPAMSPLFQAVVEAIQEAVYNAMLKAETVTSSRGKLEAIDVGKVKAILEKYRVTNFDKSLPPLAPG